MRGLALIGAFALAVLPAVAVEAQSGLEVIVEDRLVVGDSVRVEVSTPNQDRVEVWLVTAYGVRRAEVEPSGGVALVIFPPLTIAGDATVIVQSGSLVEQVEIEVEPGSEIRVVSTTVAPERVHVGDPRPVTMVAYLSDRFGNPVPDGTAAEMIIRYPDGATISAVALTRFGLAIAGHPIGLIEGAGETVTAGGDSRLSAPILFLPVTPAPFAFSVRGAVPPADGVSRVTLSTGELFDLVGNPIGDGAGASIQVRHPDGRFDVIEARVTSQQVRFSFPAPSGPERIEISATIMGVHSYPLVVEFEAVP